MQFASWQEILVGVIGLLIGLALFQLFHHFAKEYDKKHPNAPRVSGHYKTPKASYDMSKGESIFSAVYFLVVIPILILAFLYVRETLFFD